MVKKVRWFILTMKLFSRGMPWDRAKVLADTMVNGWKTFERRDIDESDK